MRARFSYANVTATLALFVVLGGVGIASIPGPDGKIHACYSNTRGSVRIVDSEVACDAGESRITFNQTGPAGATGPTGAPGPAGPAGARGAKGEPGKLTVGPLLKKLKKSETIEEKILKVVSNTSVKTLLNEVRLKLMKKQIGSLRGKLHKVHVSALNTQRRLYFTCQSSAVAHTEQVQDVFPVEACQAVYWQPGFDNGTWAYNTADKAPDAAWGPPPPK